MKALVFGEDMSSDPVRGRLGWISWLGSSQPPWRGRQLSNQTANCWPAALPQVSKTLGFVLRLFSGGHLRIDVHQVRGAAPRILVYFAFTLLPGSLVFRRVRRHSSPAPCPPAFRPPGQPVPHAGLHRLHLHLLPQVRRAWAWAWGGKLGGCLGCDPVHEAVPGWQGAARARPTHLFSASAHMHTPQYTPQTGASSSTWSASSRR